MWYRGETIITTSRQAVTSGGGGRDESIQVPSEMLAIFNFLPWLVVTLLFALLLSLNLTWILCFLLCVCDIPHRKYQKENSQIYVTEKLRGRTNFKCILIRRLSPWQKGSSLSSHLIFRVAATISPLTTQFLPPFFPETSVNISLSHSASHAHSWASQCGQGERGITSMQISLAEFAGQVTPPMESVPAGGGDRGRHISSDHSSTSISLYPSTQLLVWWSLTSSVKPTRTWRETKNEGDRNWDLCVFVLLFWVLTSYPWIIRISCSRKCYQIIA